MSSYFVSKHDEFQDVANKYRVLDCQLHATLINKIVHNLEKQLKNSTGINPLRNQLKLYQGAPLR